MITQKPDNSISRNQINPVNPSNLNSVQKNEKNSVVDTKLNAIAQSTINSKTNIQPPPPPNKALRKPPFTNPPPIPLFPNDKATSIPYAKAVFGTITPEIRKERAELLLQSLPNPTPGNKKLMTEIKQNPGQLEQDLNRLGTLSFGDRHFPAHEYASKKPSELYRWSSTLLRNHIVQKNPQLNIKAGKLDEILYSSVQTFGNEILITAHEKGIFPGAPWASKNAVSEVKFEFEKKYFGLADPDVLVVTNRRVLNYVDTDKISQGLKSENKQFIIEVKIKHDLTTGEVSMLNQFTYDNGKVETWDPCKPLS